MPRFTVSYIIRAEPHRVFAAFLDMNNSERPTSPRKRLEVLTEGEIGLGSQIAVTHIINEREFRDVQEISEYVPGQKYTIGGESDGVRYGSTFEFLPDPDGTRVVCTLRCKALTVGKVLMTPLVLLRSGLIKRHMLEDICEMQRWIEAETVPPRDPS